MDRGYLILRAYDIIITNIANERKLSAKADGWVNVER